jgi:hypothetical protein
MVMIAKKKMKKKAERDEIEQALDVKINSSILDSESDRRLSVYQNETLVYHYKVKIMSGPKLKIGNSD